MSTTVANPVSAPPAKKKSTFWTFHNVMLKLHLWLGLASALFLLILGITGAIIAFEPEADRWLHPSLWYVTPAEQMLPEAQLIDAVEQRFAPLRVRSVTLPRTRDLAHVMIISEAGKPVTDIRAAQRVWVNPYNAAILGERTGMPRSLQILAAIHQFHLHMAMGDVGTLVLSIASAILAAETILGLFVWWKLKRATISFRGSWFRVCFDAHSALGIYSALFVLMIAFTGCLIGFEFAEPMIFKLTHSRPYLTQRPPKSTPGTGTVSVDQAVTIARQALPEAIAVTTIQLPSTPTAAFIIGLRVPEETSEATHSNVWVDQYSGEVLRKQNFATDSSGYRAIRFNRSLHTGDVWGVTGHAIMGLTSLLLVVMVVTGVIIWWKKLAV